MKLNNSRKVDALLLTNKIAESNPLRGSKWNSSFTPYMNTIKANDDIPLKIHHLKELYTFQKMITSALSFSYPEMTFL